MITSRGKEQPEEKGFRERAHFAFVLCEGSLRVLARESLGLPSELDRNVVIATEFFLARLCDIFSRYCLGDAPEDESARSRVEK